MPHERVETPVVRQRTSTECFAVSLTIILRYYGAEGERDAVRAACDVSRDGADASNMLQAARDFGLEAQALRITTVDRLTTLEPPFVVYYGFNHGVVVEGVDAEHVHLNDPVRGRRTRSHAEFRDGFTGIVFTFAPGDEFEETRDRSDWTVVRTLAGELREHEAEGILAAGIGAVVAGMGIVGVLGALGMLSERPEALWIWLVAAGGLVGMVGGLGLRKWGHRRTSVERAQRAVAATLHHALRLPLSYLHQHGVRPGVLWTLVSRTLAHSLPRAATAYGVEATVLGLGGVGLALVHPVLPVGLVVAAGGTAVITVWGWRRHHAYNRDLQLQRASRRAPSQRTYRGVEEYKATAPERRHVFEVLKCRTAHNNRRQRLGRRRFGSEALLWGLVGGYVVFGSGVVAVQLGTGALSPGMAASALGLVAVTGVVCARGGHRGWDLQFEYECLRERRQMCNRDVDPLLEAAPGSRSSESASPDPAAPPLRAEGLSFRFSRDGPPVVDEVTLSLEAGEQVALVGPSGCGKSTLAEVLTGLRAPVAGTVAVKGQSLDDLPPDERAEWIGAAQAAPVLWAALLRTNLTLTASVPDAALDRAVRDAGLRPVVERHPDGLAQPVTPGRTLSAGEQRQVELARALLHDPAVVVIDETTAALDDDSAAHVREALRRRGCAVLTITHRMHRMTAFDRILVMEEGTVVQRGTHEVLAADDGPYAALCASLLDPSS